MRLSSTNLVSALGILVMNFYCLFTVQAQMNQEVSLELGNPMERELAGGQSHNYQISLASGQSLLLAVVPSGIEVVVSMFGPDGKKLAEVNNFQVRQGPVSVSVTAQASGFYRLEVHSPKKDVASGKYTVRIVELRNSRGSSHTAAQSAFNQGAQLWAQGTAESQRQAIAKYQEALQLWRDLDARRPEAQTLFVVGAAYEKVGAIEKALDHYNQALQLWKTTADRRKEAQALETIARLYSSMTEKQRALDYYSQALQIYRTLGDRQMEAWKLLHIGDIYREQTDTQKELDYYNQALKVSRDAGNRSMQAEALIRLAHYYDELGERQRARDYYNEAVHLRRLDAASTGDGLSRDNKRIAAEQAWQEGGRLSALDLPQSRRKAIEQYEVALRLWRDIGDRRKEALALTTIGDTYIKLAEEPKVLDYYRQALQLYRTAGDRFGEAEMLNRIGWGLSQIGDSPLALDYFGQLLALWRSLGVRSREAATLYHIAFLERHRGNLSAARAPLEAALEIIETQRAAISSQELRDFFLASKLHYYEFYIDLLMRLHEKQPTEGFQAAALQASERAHARSLVELLVEAGADIRQGIDPALLQRERSLQERLSARTVAQLQQLQGPYTEAQAALAKREIDTLTTEYQQIEAEIKAKSPHYAALKQPQPLTLTEMQQQLLDSDTLLLEYALGVERSYLWMVSATTITSYVLPPRVAIEAEARRFYELLAEPNQRSKTDQARLLIRDARVDEQNSELTRIASRLGQMLLAPVAPQLEKKRLLIVADGALHYIPFAALSVASGQSVAVTSEPINTKRRTKDDYHPLIVDHEIVSLPSAAALAALRHELAGRQAAAKKIAVLADPVFDKDDERVKSTQEAGEQVQASSEARELSIKLQKSAVETGQAGDRLRIPRLPGTRQEAEKILALVPKSETKQALDFAASRVTATSEELAQYQYVHFATHGFLNSLHPELSGIVLSMVNERGKSQNGFLLADEVYNLKLSAELVVLSACQTGLGQEIKGEGLVGLTRALMYAGTPRVVVSLWSVNDAATAELMERFYNGMLKDGRRPAAALREAQIEMWKQRQWQAPYYWGAFIIQGDWR